MMLNHVLIVFVLIFCLGLPTWGQYKNNPDTMPDPTAGGRVVTLSDGGVIVSVNSFGRAGHTLPGCAGIDDGFKVNEPESVLCEHIDFISTGGPVRAINAPNCTIIDSIIQWAPNRATSTVACGDCTINFHHTLDGTRGTWTTGITIFDCPVACYYSYTDYDVHSFLGNGGSWHSRGGGFLGQFVVRNNTLSPSVHYLFTDQSGAAHWMQDEFPAVLDTLTSLSTCRSLADDPPLFPDGDWSGALQYSFRAVDPEQGVVIIYSHGRDDAIPFP